MDQLDHLPASMECVICHEPHDYRHDEKPVPTAGSGEVPVKVHAAGLCASDVACWRGAFGYWPGDGMPGFVQPPVVPGHEFVGTVVGLGQGAAARYDLTLGDIAISEQMTPCWNRRFCNRGQCRIITHRLPFAEIGTALELTASGADSVKVTLAPGP